MLGFYSLRVGLAIGGPAVFIIRSPGTYFADGETRTLFVRSGYQTRTSEVNVRGVCTKTFVLPGSLHLLGFAENRGRLANR